MKREPFLSRETSLSLTFCRFNFTLNKELPRHPTLFHFLNRVKTLVYEQSINIVAQTSQGRSQRMKVTAAANRLAEKAKRVEEEYAAGQLSATDVLRLASVHYDDDAVIDLLRNEAAHDMRQQAEPADAVDGMPLDAPAVEPEFEFPDDERAAALEDDPDLEDMDAEDWIAGDWQQDDTQESLETEAGNADSSQPSTQRLPADASDLVVPVCIVCNESPDWQEVIACGHFFCQTCLARPDFEQCPICRTPKSDSFRIRIKTVMLAYRRDVDSSFGTQFGPGNREMDGHRPGDTTLAQDLERMSEELARSLSEQQEQPGE